MEEIDTVNKYMVSVSGRGDITIMNPPRGPISRQDALLLAAWLVALADMGNDDFPALLDAVQGT